MGLAPMNHALIDHLLQWHPPLDPSQTRIGSSPGTGTGSCSAPEKHQLLQTVIRYIFKARAFAAPPAVMICSSQLQQVEAQGSAKKKRWSSQVVFPCIFRQCLSFPIVRGPRVMSENEAKPGRSPPAILIAK
jgi:hypothetical protein